MIIAEGGGASVCAVFAPPGPRLSIVTFSLLGERRGDRSRQPLANSIVAHDNLGLAWTGQIRRARVEFSVLARRTRASIAAQDTCRACIS